MGLPFRLVVAALLWTGLGCGEAEPPELLVDLKTDLIAGIEFDQIIVEAGEGVSSTLDADPAADYLAGERILETAHPEGDVRVVVGLYRGGIQILGRAVRVRVEGTTGVTILMTRDCVGVACGDPAASQCDGGTCVADTCSVETPEACPAPECVTDADCGGAVACATARCLDGACFLDADDAMCAADEVCIPDVACAARTRGFGPEVQRTLRINSEGPDVARSVVPLPDGGTIVAGRVAGLMTSFEFSEYVSVAGPGDGFVARFGSDDILAWVRLIGGSDDVAFVDDDVQNVAVDATGNVYVTGSVAGAVTFGAEMTVAAGGSEEAFVASWTADGDFRWATRFEGSSTGVDVVVDEMGAVHATGYFTGDTATADGQVLTGTGGGWSAYYLALDDATGGVLDSRVFGAGGDDAGKALALTPASEVRLGVSFESMIGFGGSALETSGGTGVATVTPTGVTSELAITGGSVEDMAVTADGRTLIVGETTGPITVAGGAPVDAPEYDLFIASVDALGALEWLHVLGGVEQSDIASAVTFDAAGNTYVVGEFERNVDFGGGELYSLGGDEIFVASYDANGQHRWSRAYGGAAEDFADDIYLDAAGALHVAASFTSLLDVEIPFDGEMVQGGGGTTAVALRFAGMP